MKFMSAKTLVSGGATIYGGAMTDGPYKGYQEVGTIIVDLPINGNFDAVPDTITFAQSPKGFPGLGDCTHFKASGIAYCPSNGGGRRGPSPKPSIFGPTYSQEGLGSYIIARTAGGFESYVCRPGTYCSSPEGDWYFGLAARRVGNFIESIWGDSDLKGSYSHSGYYRFTVCEYDVVNGKIFTRSTGTRRPANRIRTSDMSPFAAIDCCQGEIYSYLQQARWYRVEDTLSSNQGPHFDVTTLSPQVVFPDMGKVNWGELAADAYDSVPFFKSNGIAYAKDISCLQKDAFSTLSLLTSLSKKGQLAKKAANLFLSFYYGWRLAAKDTEELVSAYRKRASLTSNRSKCTSQRTWVTRNAKYVATLQCYYKRYAKASGLDQFILDNDLTLTPENLWDLVPFSFVVDWFTGIGDILEDASNYYNLTQKHEVVCTGRSIKATKTVSAGYLSSRYSGTVTLSYYRRGYTRGPISPTFHFSNSVNPLDHAVEGTALIVSRR